MKKFFCCISLLLVSCFLFCGCAEVSYSVIVDSNGKIEQAFQVDLDKTAIENAGYTFASAKQKVLSKMQTVVSNQNTKIMYYAISIDATPSTCGVKCELVEVDEDTFYAYMSYENDAVFRSFNTYASGGSSGSSEDDDNDTRTQIVKGLFYNKIITFNKTVYYNLQNSEFAQDMLALFDGSQENTTAFTLSDVKYNFYYGVPTNKLYSNANETYSQNGTTIHHWVFDADNLNQEIATYQIVINPVVWYLVAIALTLLVLFVLIVVIIFKKKPKKVENTIANEQN